MGFGSADKQVYGLMDVSVQSNVDLVDRARARARARARVGWSGLGWTLGVE